MADLYPLKFKHIYKEKIWGGQKIKNELGRNDIPFEKCGECWEISAVQGDISIVENGHLAGNSLQEVIEIYMDELLGSKVYEKFGVEFPLLIKLLDTTDDLSVQVHPNDELAKERHNAYGKTEMWYVMDAEKDAKMYIGFNEQLDRDRYMEAVLCGEIVKKLNIETVEEGDVFFIPAGRIHTLGKNLLVAEIQQTSDITYRIDDWGRLGNDGKPREMHIDLSLDAMSFDIPESYKTNYEMKEDSPVNIGECDYFITNIIALTKTYEANYEHLDSFVIYMCVEGEVEIKLTDGTLEYLNRGETALIPACLKNITLNPMSKSAKILEVHLPFLFT